MDIKLDQNVELEACGVCKYFFRLQESQGVCRRLPATPIMIGAAPSLDPGKSNPIINTYFPTMNIGGWCGEFKKFVPSENK